MKANEICIKGIFCDGKLKLSRSAWKSMSGQN